MDVTYGLLYSLVQTKSIERILAPIASQISLLIIFNESEDASALQQGDMVPCAQTVMNAANKLIQVAKQQTKLSTDQDFIAQTVSACEVLELSSSSLYLAAQRLEASSPSREARNKLVQASKDVLQGTMKMLLVSDDAEVRRLITTTHIVTEKLSLLSGVDNMADLVYQFKEFTEALSVMTGLANKRQKDLTHANQRERIIAALSILKKCVPSLSVALQNSVKYRGNPQAEVGKKYVVNEILSAVRDMLEAVKNREVQEEEEESEEPGHFVTKIDQALETLAMEGRPELHSDLEMWTEGVVRHSMTVAHLCVDNHRDLIVKTCQRLLQVKGRVIQMHSILKQGSEVTDLSDGYSDVCELCIDEFCELEKNVNVALLHLVVDVFKETTEPLERLVKSSLHPTQGVSFEQESEAYISVFDDHAEKMCQVANLAAASSTDAKRVRVIRACVFRLEKLDPEIIPATVNLARSPQDKSVVRHLKLLMKEWTFELTTLLQVLDEMTDPKMFMLVSEKKVEEDINTCNGFLLTSDPAGSGQMLQSLIGRCRRVAQVAERVVDNNEDALFRNGLMVYIKQLRKAITGVRAAYGEAVSNPGSKTAVATVKRRFDFLQDTLAQVKAGLSEINHPHVLSPLRRDVRRAADTENKENLPPTSRRVKSETATGRIYPKSHGNRFIATSVPKLSHANPEEGIVPEVIVPQMTERLQKSVSLSQAAVPDGQLTYAARLVQDLVNWATKGDKQKVNLLCGDLLGWNNHVVDATQSVLSHCTQPDKKRKMQDICLAVDEIAPRVIDVAKYVLHGDFSQLQDLSSDTVEWKSKIEQVRVYVDMTVDRWKSLTDKVQQSCKLRKIELVKQQLETIRSHRTVISELVTIAESLRWESQVKGQEDIALLLEERDDLENLTITFITTAEMISEQGLTEELLQLELLGREWSVKLYSLVCRLDALGSSLLTLGVERRVWPQGEGQVETQDVLLQRLGDENKRLKELLKCACTGEEDKKTLSKNLQADMLDCTDEIKATSLGQKLTTTSPAVVIVTGHYRKHKLDLLSGKWILKAVQCLDLIRQQTSLYGKPLNDLVDLAFSVKSITNASARERQSAEFESRLGQFSNSVMSARKKVISGIQLSSELSKRSVVRQSLDALLEMLPVNIATIKSLSDPELQGDVQTLSDQRVRWCARAHHVVASLQAMTDLSPGLVPDVQKLLSAEGKTEKAGSSTAILEAPLSSSAAGKLTTTASGKMKPSVTDSCVEKSVLQSNFEPVTVDLQAVTSPVEMVSETSGEAVPALPDVSLVQGSESPGEGQDQATPNRHLTAMLKEARFMQREAEKWEDHNNPIVKVAKTMAQQIQDMTSFLKFEGPITAHLQMVETAKAVAENGQKILKFAVIIAKHCREPRSADGLRFHCGQLPTVIQQLSIISNVHSGAAECKMADRILVKNAQNLMRIILQMMNAAESVCMLGLKPASCDTDEESAIVLGTQWQQKFVRHRQLEAENAEQDDLGLRKVEDVSQPRLEHIFKDR